jgi:cytochrome P450
MLPPTGTLIPPGPFESYAAQELLSWMDQNFNRYGDIFSALVYNTSVYFIRAPRYAQHVLRKNWRNYKKGLAAKRIGMLLGSGLMVSEGEFWQSQRRMIQPAFHRDAVRALTSVVEVANVTLLKKWEDAARARTAVNVTRDVSHTVLRILLCAIFTADFEGVRPHFEILCEESARNLAFAEAFRALEKVILKVVEERRKTNLTHTDILALLMEARHPKDGLPMSDNQLVNEIMTMIVAGHETTASTINLVWFLLSQNLEVGDRLFRELSDLHKEDCCSVNQHREFSYADQVIEETLRLYPPGWLMTRKALRDDQLGDYFVPAGTEIYISPYFIQRHPDFWEEPNNFKPERFDPSCSGRLALTMLPFSVGPRNCIGEFFARLEIKIHLVTIARRLRLRYLDKALLDLEAGVNLRNKYDFIMNPEIKEQETAQSRVTKTQPGALYSVANEKPQ